MKTLSKTNSIKMAGICEQQVFQQVFMEQSKPLFNFMYYKTGEVSTSEDLVQDAFMKLWKNCAKVVKAKSKSYLFTIANNLFLDQVKHKNVVLKFRQRPKKIATHQSPEYLLEEKEFKERLEKAIASLPENQRIVFLMNRIDKKKYREIAVELGLSVKAVEKRMHKALVQLRKLTKKI